MKKKTYQSKNRLIYKNLYFGAHMSRLPSLKDMLYRATSLNIKSVAFFLSSRTAFKEQYISDSELAEFLEYTKQVNFEANQFVIHANYVTNLSSPKQETSEFSIESIIREMNACKKYNIKYFNIHCGSSLGHNEKETLDTLAKRIKTILSRTSLTVLLLENTAGQKNSIGTFEQFKYLLNLMNKEEMERIGLCLDTCHLFASGIDLNDTVSTKQFLDYLIDTNLLQFIYAIHLNNCKSELNSRLDRHQNLATGKIKLNKLLSFIKKLSQKSKHKVIPCILETPFDNFYNDIDILSNL